MEHKTLFVILFLAGTTLASAFGHGEESNTVAGGAGGIPGMGQDRPHPEPALTSVAVAPSESDLTMAAEGLHVWLDEEGLWHLWWRGDSPTPLWFRVVSEEPILDLKQSSPQTNMSRRGERTLEVHTLANDEPETISFGTACNAVILDVQWDYIRDPSRVKIGGSLTSPTRVPVTLQSVEKVLDQPGRSSRRDAPASTAAQKTSTLGGGRRVEQTEEPAELQIAHSILRELSPPDRRLHMTRLLRLASDPEPPGMLRASAIRMLGDTLIISAESGEDSTSTISFRDALLRFASDRGQPASVRGAAMRALGELGDNRVRTHIRDVLEHPDLLNHPEISRPAILGLIRLDEAAAETAVIHALVNTRKPSVYATSAFALGRIGGRDALAALVSTRGKFSEAGCEPNSAITRMSPLIMRILSDTHAPDLEVAIRATESFWRRDDREKSLVLLLSLVGSTASPVARSTAADRVIAIARHLRFEDHRALMKRLDAVLQGSDDLLGQKIEVSRRLKASMAAAIHHPGGAGGAL